jgi:hypothetical protein
MGHGSLDGWTASWLNGKGQALIALESYFDGSAYPGDWRKGSLVTLAGFAADDSVWAEFDQEWRRILNDNSRRPAAPYLHMREATKLKGPFTHRDGWNLQKVQFLVTDLLMYMQHVDKQRFRQFGCTIDLVAYRKLTEEGFSFNDPVDICNEFCPFVVLAWYATYYPGLIHSAHYFFDIEEPFKGPFEERWKEEKQNQLDVTGMREWWSVIKTVTTAEMRERPAMQAADLLAWSSNRRLAPKQDALFSHLESVMKSIIPSTWMVFDQQHLRERYKDIKKGAGFSVIPGRYGVY